MTMAAYLPAQAGEMASAPSTRAAATFLRKEETGDFVFIRNRNPLREAHTKTD
jgi:hypothetical protein